MQAQGMTLLRMVLGSRVLWVIKMVVRERKILANSRSFISKCIRDCKASVLSAVLLLFVSWDDLLVTRKENIRITTGKLSYPV